MQQKSVTSVNSDLRFSVQNWFSIETTGDTLIMSLAHM